MGSPFFIASGRVEKKLEEGFSPRRYIVLRSRAPIMTVALAILLYAVRVPLAERCEMFTLLKNRSRLLQARE
jgi:hypothetical protein